MLIVIHLFISYYEEKIEIRKKELLFCLSKNIENPYIDKITIINEGGNIPDYIKTDKKVEIINANRPTYNDFFEIINKTTNDDNINIIANTDIFFDNTLKLLNHTNLRNKCFALTRWEWQPNKTSTINLRRYDSQDVWIFKGKIKAIDGIFLLGVLACDSRIAYEIKKSGYKLTNPSLSVKTYHNHSSNLRNYNFNEIIQKPHIPVRIENINNIFINSFNFIFFRRKYAPFIFNLKSHYKYTLYWKNQYIVDFKKWIKSKKIYTVYKRINRN